MLGSRPSMNSESGILSQFPVLVENLAYRSIDPSHWHEYTQIWYIRRGNILHTINGVEHMQREGECAVIFPYTAHSLDARATEDDAEIISISFFDSGLSSRGFDIFTYSCEYARFCGMHIPAYVSLSGERRERADSLISAMREEFSRHRNMSVDLLASLLADFIKNLCTEPAVMSADSVSLEERAASITDVIRYIAENLRLKHSLDSLCKRTCMSRSSFIRNFKAVTGMTSKEFLLSERLQKAYTLLVFTDKSLGEIASEVGFYDSAYFNNAFREKYGEPPAQYRLNHRASALEGDAIFRKRRAWFLDK